MQGIGKRIKAGRIKQFNKELKKTGDIGRKTRAILTQVFGAIGIGLAIRQVAELSDVYQNFQNRLRIVTTGTADLSSVTKKLFEVANETRVSFAATAELFTRVAIATKGLGRTQEEVIAFTRTLNKAVILSGATAAEAKNGIIQLSQGLASGALRGDELRSVLEQLPAVADAIARSMGITRGELRKMGEAGKISADIIIDAMAKAAKQIDIDFSTTIPTISGAFTILGNHVTELIGEFNAASGAAETFARAIILVGENIKTILKILAAVVIGFIAVKVQARLAGISVIGFAKKAKIAALGIRSLTGAFGILVIAAVEVTSWLTSTTSALDDLEEQAAKMTSLERLEKRLDQVTNESTKTWIELQKLGLTSGALFDRFGKLDLEVGALTRKIDGLKDGTTRLRAAEKKHLKSLEDSHKALVRQEFLFGKSARKRELLIDLAKEVAVAEKDAGGIVTKTQKEVILGDLRRVRSMKELRATLDALTEKEKTRDRELKILIQLEKTHPQLIDEITAARKRLNSVPVKELVVPGFNEGLRAAVDQLNSLKQAAVAAGKEGGDALEGKLFASLVKNAKGAETLVEGVERIKASVKGIDKSTDLADRAIAKLLGPNETEEFFQQLDDLNLKLKEGRINAMQFRAAVRELGPEGQKSATLFGDGFTKAINRIKDEAVDLASVAEQLVDLFANKAVDAIQELVTQGSLDFKEFAADVLKQISRIIVRLLVMQAISAVAGAGTGGVSTLVTTTGNAAIDRSQEVETRSHGGDVEAGRPYLVGEEGPELVVPNQSGTVIPAAALQAPPAPPEINISVVNVTDPNELQSVVDGGEFDQSFVNLIARNGPAIREAIQQS